MNEFIYNHHYETYAWTLKHTSGLSLMLRVERTETDGERYLNGWHWELWVVNGRTIDSSPHDEGFSDPFDAFAAGCDAYYAWDFGQRQSATDLADGEWTHPPLDAEEEASDIAIEDAIRSSGGAI